MADSDDEVETAREALSLAEDESTRAEILANLGTLLFARYRKTEDTNDSEEAIRVTSEAVNILSEHPERALWLGNLAAILFERYERTGIIEHLDTAIQAERDTVETISNSDSHRVDYIYHLSDELRMRFEETGAIENLDEAIQLLREALSTADGHPAQVTFLGNLGAQLSQRYDENGAVTDLNEAIQVTRDAIALASENHESHAESLQNLGVMLAQRYGRTGEFDDLEEAITIGREVMTLTPDGHPARASRLNSLGSNLCDRYLYENTVSDFLESLDMIKTAVETTDLGDSDRSEYLNSLADLLDRQYELTDDIADLDHAIEVAQEVTDLTSRTDPKSVDRLHNLGCLLRFRYKHAATVSDLEKVMQITQQVVENTPQNHPLWADRASARGLSLFYRYERTRNVDDLDEACSWYEPALRNSNSLTESRILVGIELVRSYAMTSSWLKAFDTSKIVIDLVPKLTQRSLQTPDLANRLENIVGFACDAAAIAFQAQANAFDALILLELGRGVLATSLEDKRADLTALQQYFPDLATEFGYLYGELSPHALQKPSSLSTIQKSYSQDRVAKRAEVVQRLDTLIATIRQQSGFDRFLLGPSEDEMCSAASGGPLIVVNVSSYRCDAILVTKDGVQNVPLPALHMDDIKTRVSENRLGSLKVLEWLWDTITKPVLDALGFTHQVSNGEWPHIWWIPTGLLTRFPLHAAGYHTRRPGEAVIDLVMSSYSPSVKAVVQAHHRHKLKARSPILGKALLVGMKETPGYSSLGFADQEIAIVRRVCKSMELALCQPVRKKSDVVAHLSSCQMFHFAGHGHNHVTHPLKSYLALQDWRTDPLTIADLMDLNLRDSPPFLAYLSACGTGQVKYSAAVDESIHLISACYLAGFQHVIGTLWEVDDKFCVEMARTVYEGIREEAMHDDSVCRALHEAARKLREPWLDPPSATGHKSDRLRRQPFRLTRSQTKAKRLKRDIVPEDDDDYQETTMLQWVPYVHFGV